MTNNIYARNSVSVRRKRQATDIYIINKHSDKIEKKFEVLNIGDIGISSITRAELQFVISNSSNPKQDQVALNEFPGPLEIMDFPAGVCAIYGKIRAKLKKSGL